MNPDSLFVYGTLMNIELLKRLIGDVSIKIEEGRVNGRLYNCGNFPILMESKDEYVHGKLLTIENLKEKIDILDRYEGYEKNNPECLFIRKKIEVTLKDNKKKIAWVYVGNPNSEYINKICVKENYIGSGSWNPPL